MVGDEGVTVIEVNVAGALLLTVTATRLLSVGME